MPSAVIRSTHSAKQFSFKPRNGSTDLYDQSAGSDSNSIVSDNLTSGYFGTQYNSAGADDFILPGTTKHHITYVIANGVDYVYYGYAEPTSFDVVFYKKIKVKNGVDVSKVIKSCPGSGFIDLDGGHGAVAIAVSGCGAKVKGGKWHAVSVTANQYFQTAYEWFWRTNISQQGKPAYWENPGNGFGTGCTVWAQMDVCLPYTGVGPDFAFAIYGN